MNAKEEFIKVVGNRTVLCAEVYKEHWSMEEDTVYHLLKIDYDDEEYEKFLNAIDFDYDDGYGSQELHGTIWFTNGSYADRGEYDGSEWWDVHTVPDIPEKLMRLG